MYFQAIATTNTSGRVCKENLDNLQELEDFGQKAIKERFNKLTVHGYNETGYVKTVTYALNPSNDTWEKTKTTNSK